MTTKINLPSYINQVDKQIPIHNDLWLLKEEDDEV